MVAGGAGGAFDRGVSTKRIDTLGDLVRHAAGAVVAVTCRGCARGTVRYAASDLAGFYGAWRRLGSLRFRCDNCGSSDAAVVFERPNQLAAPARPQPLDAKNQG